MRLSNTQWTLLVPILRLAEGLRVPAPTASPFSLAVARGEFSPPRPPLQGCYAVQILGSPGSQIPGRLPAVAVSEDQVWQCAARQRPAWLERIRKLDQDRVNRDFIAAKVAAAREGRSLQPRPFRPSVGMPSVTILRHYLRPCRLSILRLAMLLGASPVSFRSYLRQRMWMPIGLFVKMLNLLEVEDPSWLTFIFYKNLLTRYFDFRVREAGENREVVLVTRPGKDPRPVDYKALRRDGLGGLIHEERVLRGETLQGVVKRIGGDTLGAYERNEVVPGRPQDLPYLDIVIKELGLSPSEAFIGAGHPWVPELITVCDGTAEGRKRYEPIAPRQRFPYRIQVVPLKYRNPAPVRKASRTPAKGFGIFLRRARLLSGLTVDKAHESLGMSQGGGLDNYECHDVRSELPFLVALSDRYQKGIRRLGDRMGRHSEDPLEELVILHNLHFYPRVPEELFRTEGGPVFLGSERDADVALKLLPLPKDDFRRRAFLLRRKTDLSLKDAQKAWEIDRRIIQKIESVKSGTIPPLDLLEKIARVEDPAGQTLPEWRRYVQAAFYPEIPWEFLEREGIYLACREDADQLMRYFKRGQIRDDHPGWLAFRSRVGLQENFSCHQNAKRLQVNHQSLRKIELGLHRRFNSEVAQVLRRLWIDPDLLKRLYEKRPRRRGPAYRHVARATLIRVPSGYEHGKGYAGRRYKVCEMAFDKSQPTGEVIEGVVQTAIDNLPFHPFLILTGISGLQSQLERIQRVLLQKLRQVDLPSAHVAIVINGFQVHGFREGKKTIVSVIDPEVTGDDEALLLREGADNVLSDRALSRREVPPYPSATALSRSATKRKGMKRLLFVNRHPEIGEFFPEALYSDRLNIDLQSELEAVFQFDLPAAPFPHTADGVRSTARFLGLNPAFLWLRLHPAALSVFKLRDTRFERRVIVFRGAGSRPFAPEPREFMKRDGDGE